MEKNEEKEGGANFEKSAAFNQAVFQMQRLNELIREINECSANLLGINPDTQKFGYKTMFEDICSIFVEISTKVSDVDKNRIIKVKGLIGDYINEFENKMFTKNTKIPKLKYDVWSPLEKALFRFKLDVMDLMEKHGFATPLKDDPRQAVLNQ